MEDLEPSGWLYGQDDKDAQEVFYFYKANHKEFLEVTFELFKERFSAAVKRAAKHQERCAQEEEFLEVILRVRRK